MDNFINIVWSAVTSLNTVEWIEIGLLTLVMYWILWLMRRTRGFWYIFALLGTIFILNLLSSMANALALERLFGGFLNIMPILIVVLFKEELRKLMENMYNFFINIVSYRHRSSMFDVVDSICIAVDYMSLRKIGALIAIEQGDDLSAYCTNAKILNASLIPGNGLLETIFYKGSPLHDGGVLIRKGQVRAASCTFPLCENPRIRQDYGTRHQAGMGISERHADALIIIVSEETGEIHFVHNANMRLMRSSDQLKDILQGYLCVEDAKENATTRRLRRFFGRLNRKSRG